MSNFIAGIDWVTANHIKPAVANIEVATGSPDTALDAAVGRLISAGVTCVVAAGNDTHDVINASPGRVAGAITVGAMGTSAFLNSDSVLYFSNYGSLVDVFAPGIGVHTASHVSDTATDPYFGGTSAAAPFVAGVAARYLQRNPGTSPKTVSLAITSNATVGKLGITSSPDRLLYSAFNMAAAATDV